MQLNTSKEIVIGFSLKKWPNKNDWPGIRKINFLLNEDITDIVSIDPMVHESIDLNDCKIPYQGYYFGQELLEECVFDSNHMSLAVSMIVESYQSLFTNMENNKIAFPDFLAKSNKKYNFEFLGYDIADFMLISSLTNCGFSKEKKKELKSFEKYLNKYGLFSDIEIAEKYKIVSDLRVKEHSPFDVYGLYKIDLKG